MTILYEDVTHGEPDYTDAASWATYYGLSFDVAADADGSVEAAWYRTKPTFVVIGRDMVVDFIGDASDLGSLESYVNAAL